MNQVAIFNPTQVPAHLRREMSAAAKALAGGGGSTGKRISIKGGVFRLVVDGKEVTAIDERFLDVVIVNTAPKVARTFYAGNYDESNPAPPACWSNDGEKPDATVKAPQCSNCAQCPQNAKGSGQGDARACRFSQRLAVVLANDMEGDVMQLSLPATSIFGKEEGENRPLQAYARFLIAQGVDPTALVTRLRFDTKSPVPKLFFKPMRWLDEDEADTCQKQGASADAMKAIALTVSQMDGVDKAAAAAPKATPAPAAPAEEDEEPPAPPPKRARAAKAEPAAPAGDAGEGDEPAVRQTAPAKTAAVPTNPGLAATLAEWDD